MNSEELTIEYLESDIQCIESCLAQGFDLSDWLWCKQRELEKLKERLEQ